MEALRPCRPCEAVLGRISRGKRQSKEIYWQHRILFHMSISIAFAERSSPSGSKNFEPLSFYNSIIKRFIPGAYLFNCATDNCAFRNAKVLKFIDFVGRETLANLLSFEIISLQLFRHESTGYRICIIYERIFRFISTFLESAA